ncbi:hypothetical protein PHMEG_00013661 [Phytophthora megakarya]|uniref:Uncharacterized protein n=1 Tax=Phytophthora megakarya TaxID=4795 RepID=A0A225W5R4_9STRA|nr:hypothetical protein PHMEG_00013661 [Phytophthora megakarya]
MTGSKLKECSKCLGAPCDWGQFGRRMQSTYSRMRRYQPGLNASGILKVLFQFYHYQKYGRFATNPKNSFPRCISVQLELIIRLVPYSRKPMSEGYKSLSTKSPYRSSRNTDTNAQPSVKIPFSTKHVVSRQYLKRGCSWKNTQKQTFTTQTKLYQLQSPKPAAKRNSAFENPPLLQIAHPIKTNDRQLRHNSY